MSNEKYEKAKGTEPGVLSDAYDHPPEVLENGPDSESLMQITYEFNADEIHTALKIFQKYTIYKKNMIYTLILIILFAFYLFNILRGAGDKFTIFLTVISLVVMLMIWYFPLTHLRQVVKAISLQEKSPQFILNVYEQGLRMGGGENPSYLEYDTAKLRVWETNQLIIIGQDKYQVFVIPKRCMEGRSEQLCSLLRSKLEDHYTVL